MNREGEGKDRGADPFVPGGLLLGRYEFVRVLGRGAMGEVLDVRDRRTGQRYALKRIPPELVRHAAQMQAVQANFNLVQGLTHPHIAVTRFLEADDATGQVYILMDLVRGRDLQTWLEERRYAQSDPAAPLPLSIALGICEQAASALDYAHAKPIYGADGKVSRHGVLHRDLKPANIMVVDDQQFRPGVPYILLVDFGLAAEIQASMLSSTVHVDGGNMLAGSPLYMAPEQWCGRTLTRAIDQWALGVMLYEMVEGGPPFPGPTRDELRAQAMFQPPLPPEVFSPAQWAALKIAFEKDRTKRHPNCTALVQAVAAADPTPGTIPPASAVTPGSWAGADSRAGSGAGSGSKPLPPSVGDRKGKDDTTGRWPAADATTLPGGASAPSAPPAPPTSRPTSDLLPRPRRKARRLWGAAVAVGTALLLAGVALFWPAVPRPVEPSFGSRVLAVGTPAGGGDAVPSPVAAVSSEAEASRSAATPTPTPSAYSATPAPASTTSTPVPQAPPPSPGSEETKTPPPAMNPSAATTTSRPTLSPTAPLVAPWRNPLATMVEQQGLGTASPKIEPVPVQSVEANEVVRFRIKADIPVGVLSRLHYRLVDGPKLVAEPVKDAAIDPVTGEFSWTAPDVRGLTLYRASYTVSNGLLGPEATGHAFIRVHPVGQLHWPMEGGPWSDGTCVNEELPVRWGPGKNIVWKIERPDGVGQWSPPVIMGDEIWFATRTKEKWGALCISKETGKVLRTFDVFVSPVEGEVAFMTIKPPVASQGKLFFHCGKEGAFCLDAADGKILWSNQEVAAPDLKRPTGPPLLAVGRLLLPFEAPRGTAVVALDPATGKEMWRREASLLTIGGAQWPDFRPLITTIDGKAQVVLFAGGTDHFSGVDGGTLEGVELATGRSLWRKESPKVRRLAGMFRLYGDKVFACGWSDSPPAAGALQLPDYSGGLYTATVVAPLGLSAFDKPAAPKHYPNQTGYTSVAFSSMIACLGGKEAVGVDMYSGETKWAWPMGDTSAAAVFVGGSKAYFLTYDNRVGVLDVKTGEILSVNSVEPQLWFTPAFLASERSLYLSSLLYLYRIEEPAAK